MTCVISRYLLGGSFFRCFGFLNSGLSPISQTTWFTRTTKGLKHSLTSLQDDLRYLATRGGTPLYGLYGDVPLDRIWFLASLSKTGYVILWESVLNRVYNFARVCLSCKQGIAYPKQGNKIEVVVLNRVCIVGFFCPKHGQGIKP